MASTSRARLEDDAQCLLVIIGATVEKQELVGLADGIHESTQSSKNCCSISSSAV